MIPTLVFCVLQFRMPIPREFTAALKEREKEKEKEKGSPSTHTNGTPAVA